MIKLERFRLVLAFVSLLMADKALLETARSLCWSGNEQQS